MIVLTEGLKNLGVHIVIQGLLNELVLFSNMVKYGGTLVTPGPSEGLKIWGCHGTRGTPRDDRPKSPSSLGPKWNKETSINDVPRFLAFLTYLPGLLYNVPFWGLSWTPLPTLISDVINECSLSHRARWWFLLLLFLFSNFMYVLLLVKCFFRKKEYLPILKQFCKAKIFPLSTKYIWVKSFLQAFLFLWDMTEIN